ncbi:MAG: hypothetical protein ACTSU7_00080 [Candidatus Heimdallarchaeaceae archaeon]
MNFFHLPEYVGYVEPYDGVQYSLTKMPNKFNQFMMRLIFGWRFYGL